ncbi:MAG: hypothetical protein JW903_10365 [Clostridia bacterium]|nr:hypothetical protein [Clostridia bacterium]
MKIYGAGSLEDIRKCSKLGVEGILTNPQGFDQYFEGKYTLHEITGLILHNTHLPVYIQVHGETSGDIVNKARQLHELDPRVGFKIIANEKGFMAIAELSHEGIDCIATTLFTPAQAAVAASVNALGICPFISRATAGGIDACRMLETIRNGYEKLSDPPEIIAVSLKTVQDVEIALKCGADAVGMRYPLLREMMIHPLSDKAERLFARNWANVKGEDVSYINADGEDGIAE